MNFQFLYYLYLFERLCSMITDINVKQSDSELIVSIKLEEFITSLRELPKKNGWVNITHIPR